MVANICYYGPDKHRIRRMFEFDSLLDRDQDGNDKGVIRIITFYKRDKIIGDKVIHDLYFGDDPLTIFIMENGKTVDTIKYKMDDTIHGVI